MEVSFFIRNSTTGTKVLSGKAMKILGFNFSNQPNINYHLETLCKKFRKRLWLLHNLKYAKLEKSDLKDAYCCFLRPVLDYCSNIYHNMLSKSPEEQLEKLQTSALKIVYGYDKSRSQLLEMSGLISLHERRSCLFESFCKKTHENEIFRRNWMEERFFEGPNLRRQKILTEKFAKTARLYNSPLYAMRRKINDLLVD